MKDGQTLIEVHVHDSYKGKNIETARGTVTRTLVCTNSTLRYHVSIKGVRRLVNDPHGFLPHVVIWESELPRDLNEEGY